MRVAVVVSLISVFQIHHQTIVNAFSSSGSAGGEALRGTAFTLVAAAFPLGQFLGTLLVERICRKWSLLAALDLNGICLLVGGVVSLLPTFFFLAVGRLVIGVGVGCGFVLASIVIFDFYALEKRTSAFFVSAILFGAAALYSNFVASIVANSGYFLAVVVANLPSIGAGLLYFRERLPFIERLSYSLEPLNDREQAMIQCSTNAFAPMVVSYALMGLNAFIGVPLVMAFSSVIFEAVGISVHRASQFSLLYPLAQLTILAALRMIEDDAMPSRRCFVLGGYALALMAFFCFLLSIQGIEDDIVQVSHNPSVSTALFLLLAIVSAVPCNTAFCYMSECFPNRETQIAGFAKSRTLLWILSTIETAIFLPLLNATNLFIAMLPFFVLSVILFVFLLMVMGSQEEQEWRQVNVYTDVIPEDDHHYAACESDCTL